MQLYYLTIPEPMVAIPHNENAHGAYILMLARLLTALMQQDTQEMVHQQSLGGSPFFGPTHTRQSKLLQEVIYPQRLVQLTCEIAVSLPSVGLMYSVITNHAQSQNSNAITFQFIREY